MKKRLAAYSSEKYEMKLDINILVRFEKIEKGSAFGAQ